MINDFKANYEYAAKNKLGSSTRVFNILEKMDLDDETTLEKVKGILDRYESSPNKYSEDIMCQLRQRRGLEEYDTSLDKDINEAESNDIFSDLFGWNGLRGWEHTVFNWVKEVYDIDLTNS